MRSGVTNDKGINALGEFKIASGVVAVLGYDLQIYGGKDEVLVIDQHNEHTQALFGQIRLTLTCCHGRTGGRFRINDSSVGQDATIWNVSGRTYDITSNFFQDHVWHEFPPAGCGGLFANDPQDERGNPDLKPERAKSINAEFGGTHLARTL
jgi:vitamin B12 transporter